VNIREDLKAYLDGELTAERSEEIRIALEQDESLRAEAADMQRITNSIKSSSKEIPAEGYEKTLGQLKRPARAPWLRLLGYAGGLAAIVLAAGLMGPMFISGRAEESLAHGGDSGMAETATYPTAQQPDMGGGGAAFAPESESLQSRERVEAKSSTQANADMNATPEAAKSSPGLSSGRPVTSGDSVLDPNRLVIRNGSLGVKVKDVRRAVNDTTQLVAALGGYVESSNFYSSGDEPQATMSLRIPSKKFEAALTSIRGYGELKSETLSGEDVTAQVADINARIKTLRQEEEQYRILMKSARRIDEILDIKNRISQVRQEIESLSAQQKTLGNLAAMSQLQLTFMGGEIETANAPDGWFEETQDSATSLLKSVGRLFAQGLTFLFILTPIWLPVGALIWWLRRRAA